MKYNIGDLIFLTFEKELKSVANAIGEVKEVSPTEIKLLWIASTGFLKIGVVNTVSNIFEENMQIISQKSLILYSHWKEKDKRFFDLLEE